MFENVRSSLDKSQKNFNGYFRGYFELTEVVVRSFNNNKEFLTIL